VDLLDLSFLPNFGVAGALVLIIGYLLSANHRLMTANRSDRAEYLAALAARETAHAAEITAIRTAHAAELSAMRARISKLERRLAGLEGELDAERDRRRAAEDEAAAARRGHPSPPA
jgi:septal ring factor EnvC (AmiA/AmiB activator)